MFMLRTNGALCLDSLEKDSMKLRMLMRMYRKPESRAAAVRMAEHVGRGGGRLEGGEVAGGREGGMWQVEGTEGHRNWVDAFRWALHRFYIPSLCCRRVLYI